MRALLKLLLLAGIIVYLAFAFTRFTRTGDNSQCSGVDIVVSDSSHAGFITSAEADRILRSTGIYPTGKAMKDISSQEIEQVLRKNPFIQEAVCYKTADNRLNVLISQRLPLLRVMAESGEDYYIDERGFAMEPMGYVADLAVATGHISKNFAKTRLAQLGRYLRDNSFWNDQVEQISVTKDQNVDIVPRVGDQIIHLGTPDSIPKKFRNLMAFYQKVMPEVGWNKYSEIDVRHVNQIVCTKRSKKS
ncbi:MAG: cell division protein FtsQ/DivIB [Alloprevotella sp.]|nr:cell division protein FtsQ/DivIB [Alloprevotella sp.]